MLFSYLNKKAIVMPFGLSFCLLLLAAGCGSDGGTGSDASYGDAGSAGFNINWYSTRNSLDSSPGTYAIKALSVSDCASEGVVKVQCEVYQEEDLLLTQSDLWDCAAGGGTIDGIASGENRTIVCMGFNESGEIVHLGQAPNVKISAGKTESVRIDSYPFRVTLTEPTDGATIRANFDPLEWEEFSNADHYYVQISEDEQFSEIFEEEPLFSRTSFDTSSLMPDMTYYWRVQPWDRFGHYGRWTSTRFTTEEGGACRRPVITDIQDPSVLPGQPVEFTVIVNDEDGDPLTYDNELPAGAQFNERTGQFTWDTTGVAPGNYTARFHVQDSCQYGPLDDEEVVLITIGNLPCGGAPILNPIESPQEYVYSNSPFEIQPSISNPNDYAATYRTTPVGVLPIGTAIDAEGVLTFYRDPYRTQPGDHVSFNVNFMACRTCSEGEVCSQSIPVTINARHPCTWPSFEPIDDINVQVGQPVNFTLRVVNSSVPAEDINITLDNYELPEGAENISRYFVRETLTFNWTPDEGDIGTYRIGILGSAICSDWSDGRMDFGLDFGITVNDIPIPPTIN